jgi:cytoskeletal protein CcmA (bactofilin family)
MSVRSIDSQGYSLVPSTSVMDEDDTPEPYSLIDKHSIFDGVFTSNRDLRIEGEVKGTIDCRGTLFVAQGANVAARVEAEHIAVAGDLNGDIACRGRLQIMPSGRVRGKVRTVSLVVNEGAFYEGQLEMEKPQSPVPPRPLQPVVSAPSEATVASPEPDLTTAGTRPLAEPGSSTFIRRLGGPETPWENREPNSGEGEGKPDEEP